MAFDQNILQNENTVIKWDHINRGAFPGWNQDQTPIEKQQKPLPKKFCRKYFLLDS